MCNDRMCLPPEVLDIKIDVNTGSGLIGLIEEEGEGTSSQDDIAKIIPKFTRSGFGQSFGKLW